MKRCTAQMFSKKKCTEFNTSDFFYLLVPVNPLSCYFIWMAISCLNVHAGEFKKEEEKKKGVPIGKWQSLW